MGLYLPTSIIGGVVRVVCAQALPNRYYVDWFHFATTFVLNYTLSISLCIETLVNLTYLFHSFNTCDIFGTAMTSKYLIEVILGISLFIL
jgi:hypothetical protein